MTYERINFVDQSVERPRTYEMTHNADGSVTLVDSFGLVDELGTPINADTMNHIEDGIVNNDDRISKNEEELKNVAIRLYNSSTTYQKGEWVLGEIGDEKKIFVSLIDNNKNNDLSNSDIWEEVKLGGGGGHNLFDIVQKDHILSYEETEGYELLGNYVYKEALAGSRYGYPDFYNKVIEEYNEATDTKTVEVYESSNIEVVGNIVNNNGAISGFSEDNYAQIPVLVSGMGAFELLIKFRLTDNTVVNPLISTSVNYDGLMLRINADGVLTAYVSSNGTSWNIMNGTKGSFIYQKDKDYWLKVIYDGNGLFKFRSSIDGKNFLLDLDGGTSGSLMYSATTLYNLGKDYTTNVLHGEIDLKECYLEQARSIDENWVGANLAEFSYKEHSNGHKFFDIADKEAVDKFYNANGMAWFYGIDTTNERVLLPRNEKYPNFKEEKYNILNVDWTKVTDISFPFVAPEDGLYLHYGVNKSGSVYLNGIGIDNFSWSSNNWSGHHSAQIYVRKGDVVTGSSVAKAKFVPALTNEDYNELHNYIVVGNTKTTQGYSEVVAQGKEILEQVNEGIANGIETRANLDLSNVTQSSGLRRLIEVSDSILMPSWYKVFEEVNPQTGEVKKWCEQGWTNTGSALSSTQTVTFLKEFADTNYQIFKSRNSSSSDNGSVRAQSFYNRTTKTADTYILEANSNWYAFGYIN